jgi:ATP-dependent DNA ligase
MVLPIEPPYSPMEALSVDTISLGSDWQYEPKWDGFRCLIFRDGDRVELQSKSGRLMTRYFPELVEAIGQLKLRTMEKSLFRQTVDSPLTRCCSESIRRPVVCASLRRKPPALLIVFDLLVASCAGVPTRRRSNVGSIRSSRRRPV